MSAQELNGSRRSRTVVRLGARLEKALVAYAAAAVAAGVGLLALAPCAEAKIVFTPAHIDIPVNGSILLDLNHDGIADFSFLNDEWRYDEGEFEFLLGVKPKNPSNAVWGRGTFSSSFPFGFKGRFAAALRARVTVLPSKSYFRDSANGLLAEDGGWAYSSTSRGQWLYTRGRYLGLKFVISGENHYGWVRLTVGIDPLGTGIQAAVTGYAYETIPNKPIITGKTKGPDVIILGPATLGRLAKGTTGIPDWRKKQ
ncbi:MAG TPA: hypothetical protein VNZ03_02770 [Terriglobales bacterium]|nr:hypothetical protein [Terriglobales bacterium]